MFAVDDPFNADLAPVSFVVTQAVELSTGQSGLVGDSVTGMIPWSDDLLIIGGNSSIKVLIVFLGFRNMFNTAVFRERSLMRCAAHSAFNSEQGMPQTFSVYPLKKAWKRRFPKRFVTHCSNVSSRR